MAVILLIAVLLSAISKITATQKLLSNAAVMILGGYPQIYVLLLLLWGETRNCHVGTFSTGLT